MKLSGEFGMTLIRSDLEALPERMKHLRVDSRGYVVPWFVAWIDGPDGVEIPEFRAMDDVKFVTAVKEKRCWVCGGRLGARLVFVVGPMCGINRVSSEPPSHLECAQWSARNCPFMSKPQMVRREGGSGVDPSVIEEAKQNVAGVMIERNPGVTLLWVCRDYKLWRDPRNGHYLIDMGNPEGVEWWASGRPATRVEVEASVDSGLPLLMGTAEPNPEMIAEISRRRLELEQFFPPKLERAT
jgi:hypothetical protein